MEIRSRSRRVVTASVALVAGLVLTSGCSVIQLDLGAKLDPIGFRAGAPIIGSVTDPRGEVTVRLVPAFVTRGKDPVDLRATLDEKAAITCTFSRKNYSCPTRVGGQVIAEGRYVVRVQDHDAAYGNDDGSDGVATIDIPVVVTGIADYDPSVGQEATDLNGAGGRFPRESYVIAAPGVTISAPLSHWAPGSTVTARIRDEYGRTRQIVKAPIGPAGNGTLRIAALPAGSSYSVTASDGVWAMTVPITVG